MSKKVRKARVDIPAEVGLDISDKLNLAVELTVGQ